MIFTNQNKNSSYTILPEKTFVVDNPFVIISVNNLLV